MLSHRSFPNAHACHSSPPSTLPLSLTLSLPFTSTPPSPLPPQISFHRAQINLNTILDNSLETILSKYPCRLPCSYPNPSVTIRHSSQASFITCLFLRTRNLTSYFCFPSFSACIPARPDGHPHPPTTYQTPAPPSHPH